MSFSTIGILGGMGPEATRECFDSIISHTPADSDQEHVPVLVYNNPQIPDRTEAILRDGEDPLPYLESSAKKLEEAGADIIIVPCNTAHYFLSDIRNAVDIEVLNMIKETLDLLNSGDKAGLLATTGTIRTGIYENYSVKGGKIITPSVEEQETIMDAIYGEKGIKVGHTDEKLKEKLIDVTESLKQRGANSIIAGCTEIRLVLSDSDLENMSLLTPLDVIAKKAVRKSRGSEEVS